MLHCPECPGELKTVTDTRKRDHSVYRRRICDSCGGRFSTSEVVDPSQHETEVMRLDKEIKALEIQKLELELKILKERKGYIVTS